MKLIRTTTRITFEPKSPKTSVNTVPTGSASSPERIASKSGWARISAAVMNRPAKPPT